MFKVLRHSQEFFLKNSENGYSKTRILELKSPYKNSKIMSSWFCPTPVKWSALVQEFLVMQSKDGNIKTADVEW